MVDLPPLLKAALRLQAETDISRLFLPAMSSPNHSPLADHQITPPPELFKQWEDDILNERDNVDHVLDCAWRHGFHAGADQELEACCKLLELSDPNAREFLCAARRPKPPNLAEEALAEIQEMEGAMYSADLGCDFTATRRALERLQELENND